MIFITAKDHEAIKQREKSKKNQVQASKFSPCEVTQVTLHSSSSKCDSTSEVLHQGSPSETSSSGFSQRGREGASHGPKSYTSKRKAQSLLAVHSSSLGQSSLLLRERFILIEGNIDQLRPSLAGLSKESQLWPSMCIPVCAGSHQPCDSYCFLCFDDK
jgi:hypothetical protein